MEEKQLNSEESLELITRMIRQTRSRVERNAAQPFLVMGYLTVAVSIAVWFALRATHNPIWHLLWFVIPIAGLFYNGIVRRANREKAVTTYIDRVVGYVWWVFGSAAVLCSLL